MQIRTRKDVIHVKNICSYVQHILINCFFAQVVSDPSLTKSGVYWSWNQASASFENQLSPEASDAAKARKIWKLSDKLVGLA